MTFFSKWNATPAGIYLLKVSNRNTRTKVWNIFKVNNNNTVNFEHISHICSSVSIVNFEHVIAGWDAGLKWLKRKSKRKKYILEWCVSAVVDICSEKFKNYGDQEKRSIQ